jgi:predicted outer membrane repeat protein
MPAGGTVDFQPGLSGTITLTTGELDVNQDVTLEGPGASVITVSGNNASRVFNIGKFTVSISGLTISDGSVPNVYGGGINNLGTLTVTDCTFSNNSASGGGGIYNDGPLTVTDSTFSGNSASNPNYGGGGIDNRSTLTVTDSTFSGNYGAANGGGGGILNAGMMTVTDSIFNGNSLTTYGAGGGIFNEGTSTSAVFDSTFSGNSASGQGPASGFILDTGGAIYNGGPLTVIDCTFAGNSANNAGAGGGIANGLRGTLAVTDSTFSGNSANNGGIGGGINDLGTLTITDSTFSGNSAVDGGGINNDGTSAVNGSTFSGNSASFGGGIENGGTLTITASTVSGNSVSKANGGGGIYNLPSGSTVKIRNTLVAGNSSQSGGPDVAGPLTSLGHNLIGDGAGGSGYAVTDLVGTSATPIDPMLGTLQNNGGPTWTMALLPGSPAIGAGALTDMEWDQRGPGYPRTINGTTDIGAYEVQPMDAGSAAATFHLPDLIHPVPVVARTTPSAPTVPLRRAADTVDRVFACCSSDAVGLVAGRPQHAAGTELLWWAFDPLPV